MVARERLPDLHDSLTSRRPDLLGISEDAAVLPVYSPLSTVTVREGDSMDQERIPIDGLVDHSANAGSAPAGN